jgi:hypothetical protein
MAGHRRLVAEAKRRPEPNRGHAAAPAVTIRFASAEDGPALDRLASLDSAQSPAGPTLIAEQHGELVAALAIDGGRPLADPFRRTAEVVRLLELRASQMKTVRRTWRRRLLPRLLNPRTAER